LATLKSWNNSKIAINTPNITFSSDKLGIEKEVQGVIAIIEDEAYAYLYENKKAQQDLWNQIEEAEEEVEVEEPVANDEGLN
jgi:hypothetical protein